MPKPRTSRSSPLDSPPGLGIDIDMGALLDETLQSFEDFVRSEARQAKNPIGKRLAKLLDADPDAFRAIFSSGVISGVETLAKIFQAEADRAEAYHEAYHAGRTIPRA